MKKPRTNKQYPRINVRATLAELKLLGRVAKKTKSTRRQVIWAGVSSIAQEVL